MASDDIHHFRALLKESEPNAPQIFLGCFKGHLAENAVFLAGSFVPVHFTPRLWSRALLTREFAGGSRIPLSERGLVMDLNCRQGRQPWGLMGRLLGPPLVVHSAHITNTSRIKGCCACTCVAPPPPESDYVAFLVRLLTRPGVFQIWFKLWEQGRFSDWAFLKTLYSVLTQVPWWLDVEERIKKNLSSESQWRKYLDSLKIAMKDTYWIL